MVVIVVVCLTGLLGDEYVFMSRVFGGGLGVNRLGMLWWKLGAGEMVGRVVALGLCKWVCACE